jgi:hypothetical protein
LSKSVGASRKVVTYGDHPQEAYAGRTYKLGFQVHAWLMHSVDCIEGNSKYGVKFWGAIADSYNTTIETHHHRTAKNLKDHWVAYNKHVSLFNQINNQESSNRQSRANDGMVLRTSAEFKCFH